MYVLVVWAVLNGTTFADTALFKTKERCEAAKEHALEVITQNPAVQKPRGVCINVLETRI